ncbi:MAG: hypothetical protein IPN08_01885 [Bacteroidales bacterium]|nr:hypothetical protein [Bacteroidales bacterium]
MILTISEQATANAGSDATICEGSTYTMIATATNAASITWSSNGTGTFADATIEDAVYTPSLADRLNGSITLTMTVTSASPCINAIDQMVLSINPQATVNAGTDATICETGTHTLSGATQSNATSLAWTTSGDGSFSSTTWVLNPIHTPGANDLIAGTVTLTLTAQSAAPCVEASDAMVLTISEQATANAGSDATICEGSTYTMMATATNTASITWSSNGTGTFADATIEDAVYTPSAGDILNGTVTLTMTVTSASPCINATDQMVLSINPQATVNAGADATICETGTYTLSGATQSNATSLAWTTSGDGSFSSTTVLNPIYTPGANDLIAGTVTLTLTAQSAAPCVEASDAMVLTISEQATANAGVDATICEGSTYTMIATATNAASILWSSNGTGTFADATIEDAVYTPSAADILNGSVTLTMTVTSASPCINAVDQMVLSINPQATVNAGADATICETGTYTLKQPHKQCNQPCLDSTGKRIIEQPTVLKPIYTLAQIDLIAGTVTLTLTAQSAAPCVEASDAMVLTISEQATANAGFDATICEGSTYTMIATATNAASITWSSNGTGTFADATIEDAVYTPSAADILNGMVTLTMTVTSASPCINAIDQMVLSINPQATVSAGADATICETGTYTLSTATQSNAISLAWTTSGDGSFSSTTVLNPIYTPGTNDLIAGTVTLTLTAQSAAPCVEASDAMILTISEQATANAGIDATICEGSTYTMIATATNAASITWSSNGTGTFADATIEDAVYTPSAADRLNGSVTLTMTVTSASPCINAVDQMVLSINPQATVSAGADATICETGTYTLSGATSTNATSLAWTTSGDGSFSSTTVLNPIYTPGVNDLTAGTVTLTLTAQSAAPCVEASDAMVLTISEQATANAGVDATICEGSTYTMIATATNAASITWSSNGTGTLLMPRSKMQSTHQVQQIFSMVRSP